MFCEGLQRCLKDYGVCSFGMYNTALVLGFVLRLRLLILVKPTHALSGGSRFASAMWEFPKIRGTLFGVLIIRILLFRVLY